MKYRSKGGVFRSPMDFARLYGLTRKQFRELEPYITIGDDYAPASTLASVQAYIARKAADKEAAHEAYEAFGQAIRTRHIKNTTEIRCVIR